MTIAEIEARTGNWFWCILKGCAVSPDWEGGRRGVPSTSR